MPHENTAVGAQFLGEARQKPGSHVAAAQIALPPMTWQLTVPLAISPAQLLPHAPQLPSLTYKPFWTKPLSVTPSQSSSWPLQVSVIALAPSQADWPPLHWISPLQLPTPHGAPLRFSSVAPLQLSSKPLQVSGAGATASQGVQPLALWQVRWPTQLAPVVAVRSLHKAIAPSLPGRHVHDPLAGTQTWPSPRAAQSIPAGQLEPLLVATHGMRQKLPSAPTAVQLPPRHTASLVQLAQANAPSGRQVGVTSPPGATQE